MTEVIRARAIRVTLTATDAVVVDDVDLSVGEGQILGLAGESGSGKTTLGLALLGYARRGTAITGGEVWLGGRDLIALSPKEQQRVRGSEISYIPQDPGTALNPARRIDFQITEVLRVHSPSLQGAEIAARVATVFGEVGLPSDPAFLRRYPHELSGGQQQRIGIAMAFISQPAVIVLDEPTTGLDVMTQQRVLETIKALCLSHGTAAVYISHDLAVVGALADRIAVMYAGELVETGTTAELLSEPAHPYTQKLLEAVPEPRVSRAVQGLAGRAPSPGSRPEGCAFAPRCDIAQDICSTKVGVAELGPGHLVRCHFARRTETTSRRLVGFATSETGAPARLTVKGLSAHYGAREVLSDISFDAAQGDCLALVGESGSGKSTLSRCLVGLHHDWTGVVELDGRPLALDARRRDAESRRKLQYVFQNPYASLNPKKTIEHNIALPLVTFGLARGAELRAAIVRSLEQVALDASYCERFPFELSGGERQRVAIARAISSGPSVLICDEVTSALDVSVQASVVTLLQELRETLGLTLIFVTHNLALVRTIATRVAVLNAGRLVEIGDAERVLDQPVESYTRLLREHTPSLEEARDRARRERSDAVS
jgi:peptide/nickel transport system ATP-binding protein